MLDLKITDVNGIRVLTTQQLAEAYGTTKQIISYNFNYNKSRYVEGKHYIALTGQALKDFKAIHEIHDNLKFANILYFWTEKGALLHAKSLNTDKAWEVYDYLVDFCFRTKAKQEQEEKNEVVPVTIKTEPLKEELSIKLGRQDIPQDAISTFGILMKIAESKGFVIKSKDLQYNRSRLHKNRIAVRKGLTLEEVNYEIAFELYHAIVNYDKGNLVDTPLAKYYNTQAERAAALIIELLNKQEVSKA